MKINNDNNRGKKKQRKLSKDSIQSNAKLAVHSIPCNINTYVITLMTHFYPRSKGKIPDKQVAVSGNATRHELFNHKLYKSNVQKCLILYLITFKKYYSRTMKIIKDLEKVIRSVNDCTELSQSQCNLIERCIRELKMIFKSKVP